MTRKYITTIYRRTNFRNSITDNNDEIKKKKIKQKKLLATIQISRKVRSVEQSTLNTQVAECTISRITFN